jgi:hypothetical protein
MGDSLNVLGDMGSDSALESNLKAGKVFKKYDEDGSFITDGVMGVANFFSGGAVDDLKDLAIRAEKAPRWGFAETKLGNRNWHPDVIRQASWECATMRPDQGRSSWYPTWQSEGYDECIKSQIRRIMGQSNLAEYLRINLVPIDNDKGGWIIEYIVKGEDGSWGPGEVFHPHEIGIHQVLHERSDRIKNYWGGPVGWEEAQDEALDIMNGLGLSKGFFYNSPMTKKTIFDFFKLRVAYIDDNDFLVFEFAN